MTVRIPLSVPSTGPAERAAVLEALDSGWIAPAGPHLDRFEQEIAERTGRRRAVAVSSGSAALRLALLIAGVRPGDRVLVPTLTFIATAAAVIHAGGRPLFVDCDASGNLDPELADRALAGAERAGDPVRAVVPVDLYGRVADHPALQAVAESHGAAYVVDAAESLGARRAGRPAGSEGELAALSFNGNKIATASSGGALVTDDDAQADRARYLATQAREPVPHYEHREIGYNDRLSNILAALGLAQVQRLEELIGARRAHRAQYRALAQAHPGLGILGDQPGREGPAADAEDNCWLTSLVIDPEATGTTPEALRDALAADGIETRPVFAPMHGQPVFADETAFLRLLNGTADRLYRTGLSVPSSPASRPEDITEVCERLHAALTARTTPTTTTIPTTPTNGRPA